LTDARGELDLDAVGDPVVGDPAVELLQGDPKLQPGQVDAQALVRSVTERDVLLVLAVDVEGVRIGVPGLRGPRALEELAALLISTRELTGDDLRRLPPKPAAGS